MPPRRPLSPLSLDPFSPQVSDLDTDGSIVASDDELDATAWASRKRRIEKIADSYRRGAPPFILSASLRGPLDQGWVNPWRKNRKRKVNPECNPGSREEAGEAENLVVQETDPRRRKFCESSESRCRKSPIGLSGPKYTAPPNLMPSAKLDRSRKSKSPGGERSRNSTSPKRVKGSSLGIPGLQAQGSTQIPSPSTEWLKKDRICFRSPHIDPPSSPTQSLTFRRLDSNLSKRQSMESSTRRPTPRGSPTTTKEPTPNPPTDTHTLDTAKPSSSTDPISHSDQRAASSLAANAETSICIVSPSSHLPTFEYRRRRKKRRSKSSSVKKTEHRNPDQPVHTQYNSHSDLPSRISPRESTVHGDNSQIERNHQGPSVTSDIKAGGEKPAPCAVENKTSHSTKEDTDEKPPSAQQMPKNPSMTDCEISLHSTAVPKGNTDREYASPSAELSTQAAFLHAQKLFQDDLDTPEQAQSTGSKGKWPSSKPLSRSESQPGSITPFHRMNTPDKDPNGGGQAMSTQYMIDTVTPFSVSTGKTTKHAGSSTKSKSSRKKQKKTSFATLPPSFTAQSPSHENEAPSEPGKGDIGPELPPPSTGSQAESQWTALPFTLTGSTPPTGQDGEEAEGPDSFNLNQAIAEAGSWLQQSFDLNNDLRQCGKTALSSPADAQRSAMNLDTIK